MLRRLVRGTEGWKERAALNLQKIGVPDPRCATGLISANSVKDKHACCAGYCGECGDHGSCKSVRGQDSEGACCAKKVLELECGGGAAANECLKSCDESVPPCIVSKKDLNNVKKVTEFKGDSAAKDCTKAIKDWRKKVDASLTDGKKQGEKAIKKVDATHKKK